ncbi:MAG TPA: HWE histidine kinase domain-containing protein [Pseudolabrys sp.]|nr:HWE histidine kinase domain-containing protein [Pseudolabrys sp.]
MNHVAGSSREAANDAADEAQVGAIVEMLRAEPAPLERGCRELLDALPAAVYTTDAEGRITYYNDAAAQLWGRRPELGSSEWCGSWKLFAPDGTPMPHRECPMAVALRENRAVRGLEAAAERPDGTRVPFLPYPTPLHDEAGRLTGAVNMLIDISERKQSEEQQAVLMRELHHRVRNTLASVQAIIGATARSAETVDDFRNSLIERIGSLAKTHLLLNEESGAALFEDIARKELAAFDDGGEARVQLSGPPVELPSRLAVTLGMALHELTTNAAKHGALKAACGSVRLSWSVTGEAGRRTLDIDWIEYGGPTVTEPACDGFGARLIKFVLPAQLRAETRIEYPPDGIRVHCAVPLPAEADQRDGA